MNLAASSFSSSLYHHPNLFHRSLHFLGCGVHDNVLDRKLFVFDCLHHVVVPDSVLHLRLFVFDCLHHAHVVVRHAHVVVHGVGSGVDFAYFVDLYLIKVTHVICEIGSHTNFFIINLLHQMQMLWNEGRNAAATLNAACSFTQLWKNSTCSLISRSGAHISISTSATYDL